MSGQARKKLGTFPPYQRQGKAERKITSQIHQRPEVTGQSTEPKVREQAEAESQLTGAEIHEQKLPREPMRCRETRTGADRPLEAPSGPI